MDNRELKLTHIRDVVAVAEQGSLRGASRVLGVAQPAITRSIREVEQYLGGALFERTAKGVVPTLVGTAFIRRAIFIRSELARARDEIAQMLGSDGGRVAVGLSTVPHLALLPRALPLFRSRYPKVVLTVQEGLLSRLQHHLEDGQMDFYIGPLSERDLPPSLGAELLFDNTRVIFACKGHPLSNATSLHELTSANWISTAVTHDSEAELSPMFTGLGLPAPRITMHAQSALTMVLAAASSDLLCMLPRQWVRFPAIGDLLTEIKVKQELSAPSIYIVKRRGLPLTPAAEFFHDLLRRVSKSAI